MTAISTGRHRSSDRASPSSGYDYAEGEAGPAYAGRLERFRRHVVHVRPGIFVMFDDLRAAEPARFQWLLHAYRRIQIAEANRVLRVDNDPAAMNVHLLLPDRVEFTQTDKYEPEPEPIARQWENTWHLTAGTAAPARRHAVPGRHAGSPPGTGSTLPKVELVPGTGAVGVRLTARDGAEDIVAFRTDPNSPDGGLRRHREHRPRVRPRQGQGRATASEPDARRPVRRSGT